MVLVECELEVPVCSAHGLAVSPVGLLAQVRLDLVPEHQHAQVRVRGLVHGFGLDAHAVLLGGQLVCTVLLVPQVEQPWHRRPHHHQLPVQVLPVQVHVLATPAFHFQVKAPCKNSVRNRYLGAQATRATLDVTVHRSGMTFQKFCSN